MPRIRFLNMEKIVVEIPVEWLQIGLYVSRLDCPWSETPFLFQGFEIESDDEIAQLRSVCKAVYVELTTTEAEELKRAKPSQAAPILPQVTGQDRLSNLAMLLATCSNNVTATDPVSLKNELIQAKEVFGQARRAVSDILNRIRRSGRAEVSLLDGVMDSMIDSVFRNRDALNWLACMKKKDDYLYNHSLSSSIWALAFGRHLGLDKASLKVIGMGAMLLDIGKTKLPDDLLKSGANPTPEDWVKLRAHVDYGLELVQAGPKVDVRINQMIESHHERMDGSGYPHQLKGDAIPLVGQIAGIVDCYDARTSDRHHARGKSTYEAILELKKLGGTWFQPELTELFIQAVGVFPTGTLVELNTGEVGVVVAQNRFRRLRPEVMMILDAGKNVRDEFVVIDLQMREQKSATGEQSLWITQGLEPGAHGIDPTEYFL